jgi:anthranilate phosphoribosyltransferase
VAKHGNYGVSSVCGSSNVMEYLGLKFTNDKSELRRQLETANICILHAPMFHPAMKYVGGIRKELGFKTFFNMVGPMVNPTLPAKQFVGVFSLELARLYSYLYQKSDKDYVIVHSLDGYDEISLTSAFKIISRNEEKIVEPKEINFKTINALDIVGGVTIADSAEIFMKVINGKGSVSQNNVVIANATLAIHCVKPQLSILDCTEMAKESLLSKKALQSFNVLLTISK